MKLSSNRKEIILMIGFTFDSRFTKAKSNTLTPSISESYAYNTQVKEYVPHILCESLVFITFS